jgi:hypothetical protein
MAKKRKKAAAEKSESESETGQEASEEEVVYAVIGLRRHSKIASHGPADVDGGSTSAQDGPAK